MKNVTPSIKIQRQQLRQELRAKRNLLSLEQQQNASNQIAQQLMSITKVGDVVALYLANDGELSPNLAISQLQKAGRICLLPVMHSFRKGYLNFQRYQTTTPMISNHFGISEPKLNSTETYPLSDIDYIFMPLVGFDDQGNRMGMGGGFYDRTLAKIDTLVTPPKLIGLAHDCQQVALLPIESWDIAIDQIITPSRQIIGKNNSGLSKA